MTSKNEIVQSYFNSWITRDNSIIRQYFDNNIEYTECYGPVYRNRDQVLQWFNTWNRCGRVLAWNIQRSYECGNTLVAEWNFKCLYKNEICDFDGVSVIQFENRDRIQSIREYEAKSTHFYPYENCGSNK